MRYASARWSAARLAEVVAALAAAAPGLAALPDDELLAAWSATVGRFRDPQAAERRAVAAALPALSRLSPEGLAAGLEAVLGGVDGGPAARLLGEAAARTSEGAAGRGRRSEAAGGPVLVVLASNLPALAVQPLLPLLALRRPVLLKSPSAEPLFAPAFVAALGAQAPVLARAVAAVTWPGGDRELEAQVLAGVERVIAYGDDDALADLARRAPGKVLGYGPKTSLAVVARDAVGAATAAGLARDVALFDQRGCLSVVAVYTDGDAVALARLLAEALAALAARWPPGPASAGELAGVQQVRLEAVLRGLDVVPVETLQVGKSGGGSQAAGPLLGAGSVVVEPTAAFRPSPGLRTVRVHGIEDLAALPDLLAAWRGRLQGVALAGNDAWALAGALTSLGISRCAAPGDLQSADASWHNGGARPLDILAPARQALPTPRRRS